MRDGSRVQSLAQLFLLGAVWLTVRTTADIYSHAIRGRDHAAAQCWDDIMQRARREKSTGVN